MGIVCLSDEERRNLASKPDVVVMEAKNEHEFQPWEPLRVLECIEKFSKLTLEGKPPDEDLREFIETHRMISKKLADKSFVSNPQCMSSLRALVNIRTLVTSGEISEEQGSKRAVNVATNHHLK